MFFNFVCVRFCGFLLAVLSVVSNNWQQSSNKTREGESANSKCERSVLCCGTKKQPRTNKLVLSSLVRNFVDVCTVEVQLRFGCSRLACVRDSNQFRTLSCCCFVKMWTRHWHKNTRVKTHGRSWSKIKVTTVPDLLPVQPLFVAGVWYFELVYLKNSFIVQSN